MNKFSFLLLIITPLIMTSSIHAVTYPFPGNEPAYIKDESVMKVGTKLYLFHSGTEEVKRTIRINDVLAVYREYPPGFSLDAREVGKVRILSILGEYFFEGEVIEGAIQPGYVAIKGSVACYITSFKKNCHERLDHLDK